MLHLLLPVAMIGEVRLATREGGGSVGSDTWVGFGYVIGWDGSCAGLNSNVLVSFSSSLGVSRFAVTAVTLGFVTI